MSEGRPMPAFAKVMPKIMGGDVCVVPFRADRLKELKAAAVEGLSESKLASRADEGGGAAEVRCN
jgi:hypothetical protein